MILQSKSGSYSKPGIKELQTNDNVPGYVCLVCSLKYRFSEGKRRCETWHEAENLRQTLNASESE
jgi:hypothetical protein